jgi:NitT/TauT family transport system substrate-binding protein
MSDVRAAIIASGCDVDIRPVFTRGIQIAHAGRLTSSTVVRGNMSRNFLRAISATIVGLSVLAGAGCAGSGGGPPQVSGLEKTNLTVGAVPVADEAGLYIAQDQGLFAAEGLHVTIEPILSSADATKGQNSGKFDITAGNAVSYVQAQVSHQSDLEIVAEGSLMQPDNQALYTLPGSPVTTIADLKGRRIGVNVLNNIGTLLISSVLQEHGLSARDVHFVPVPFPLLGQALKRHAIDVAWLPEPTASADAESMGLAELADLNQGATQGFPVGWYVATKAWAKKNPRTLAAFLYALRQGQQIADSSRTAVEQAMEKLPPPFTVSPPIAAVMSIETYPLNIAPNIDQPRVQRVADAMLHFHMLKTKFEVSSMLGRNLTG